MNAPEGRIVLIAGEGALPVEIARRLHERGTPPVVVTLRGDGEAFAPWSEAVVRLRFPSLGRVVREARRRGAERLIMAGHIAKRTIYLLPALFDPLTRSVLSATPRDDHALLGSIVEAFEREGIAVLPYWQILPEFLAPEGRLGFRAPTEAELQDVRYGAEVLSVTLPCSFGQALVVADRAVVAVEAMEGTDAMIGRCGALSGRGVVVKMMRSDQDLRYDLPTVGPGTIESMRRAGLTCLAVEAGRTLILEPERTLESADACGIAVWGIRSCPSS